MIRGKLVATLSIVAVLVSGSSLVVADSADASCNLSRDGQDKQRASGPCTFSQRQGYIDIKLTNGKSFNLSPGDQADHFTDQDGHKVVRTHARGDTHTYEWAGGRQLVVDFGGAPANASASEGVAVADMGRYCVGEASARFGVNPRDIATQDVNHTQGMYEVFGQYRVGQKNQVFVCSFNAEREFLSVDKQ